ncbi:hypothetical protein ACNHE5_19455 [Pandoraea pnomenusa]|uniref:hypothetical protein n=1 Tax=Pandoraea pnomenusa TaxID=93220 RepID=UPI003CF8BF37
MALGLSLPALDLPTLQFVTFLLSIATGILFMLDALRRDEAESPRWWSLAFLLATFSPVLYLLAARSSRLAILYPLGNAVATLAFAWYGAVHDASTRATCSGWPYSAVRRCCYGEPGCSRVRSMPGAAGYCSTRCWPATA